MNNSSENPDINWLPGSKLLSHRGGEDNFCTIMWRSRGRGHTKPYCKHPAAQYGASTIQPDNSSQRIKAKSIAVYYHRQVLQVWLQSEIYIQSSQSPPQLNSFQLTRPEQSIWVPSSSSWVPNGSSRVPNVAHYSFQIAH